MADLRLLKEPEKVIVFYRKGLLFAFNFHPIQSYTSVLVPVPNNADYTISLSSDDLMYGGQDLVSHMTYPVKDFDGQHFVELYLPARTAIVLKEGEIRVPAPAKRPRAKKAEPKKAAEPTEKAASKRTTAKKATAVKAEATAGAATPKRRTTKTTKKAATTKETEQ